MARKARLDLPGVTQHVIQRGNNRSRCFHDNKDFAAYSNWLKETALENSVSIHAWVLMTNHVHLLATPQNRASISKMMQSLGRKYVAYFNHRHGRTGTLWEGRFKSCLVDSRNYVLACYRYIELNPVRANMVSGPEEYHWSSFHSNALGKSIELCTPHAEYLSLGENRTTQQSNYLALFEDHRNHRLFQEIREYTARGLAVGSESFLHEIELLSGTRARPGKPGRPRK